MEDARIVELYWERDEAAIAESSAKYGGYCYQIAFRILALREDAEECVGDTWLRAWEAMPPSRPGRLDTFLGKITRNLSLDRWRALRAQKRWQGQAELALTELGDCLPASGGVEQEVEAAALAESMTNFGFDRALYGFEREGFSAIRDAYKARCVNLGRHVTFDGGEGTALDVDEEGRLVVQGAEGSTHVFTGEVSVHGIYGAV